MGKILIREFDMPALLTAISMLFICWTLFPTAVAHSEAETTWDALIGGLGRSSTDNRLREKFSRLCGEGETVLIDANIDTGGGLYMPVDVPVYRQPNLSKITELKDKAAVILSGETQNINNKEWVRIIFLHISSQTGMAVDIDEGWIEGGFIKE